jgi:anti-sigma B factor antagonist
VLGALLDARRRALEGGQGFVVCLGETVEPGVQRILDITGLVPVLPVVRGRQTAIDEARSNGLRPEG